MTRHTNGTNTSKSHGRLEKHLPEFGQAPSSVEELLSRGELAARMLNNPVAHLALQMSLRDLQNQWLESAPEEKNKREGLYWTSQGLNSFYNSLHGFIQQAESIKHQEEQAYQRQQAAQAAGISVDEI